MPLADHIIIKLGVVNGFLIAVVAGHDHPHEEDGGNPD